MRWSFEWVRIATFLTLQRTRLKPELGRENVDMASIWRDATGREIALLVTLLVGVPLLSTFMPTLVFKRFVALKSPPRTRAAWTVGSSMILIFGAVMLGGMEGIPPLSLLTLIPAGILVYWYWRWEFSKAWIDDSDDFPEGMKLENDDWRYGLAIVISVALVATIKALLRHAGN